MLLARPLTWLLEDNNIISEMQYGSRSGKLCQSAALNKQLVFDNLRLTKETVVFIENDAMGCFDRIVNPLILLFLLWLGIPNSVVASLALTWASTAHHIRTKYGVSQNGYVNTAHTLLFGPGQGATLGPFIWLLCFILMVLCMDPSSPRLHHTSGDSYTSISHLGESFADDTNLGCTFSTSDPPAPTPRPPEIDQFNTSLQRLQKLVQHRSVFFILLVGR